MLSSKRPIPRQNRIQKTKKITNYIKNDSKQKFFNDLWDKLINYNLDENSKKKYVRNRKKL